MRATSTDRCAYRATLAAFVAMGALLVTGAGTASADEDADRAAAIKLVEEGVQLMKESQCDEAIARFKDSMKIVPSPVTLINIGTCHERRGRIASAFAAFREAEHMADESGRKKYMRTARDAADALEVRLPRLVISAPALDRSPDMNIDMTITRNLSEVARDDLGTVLHVDPGEQDITVTATGYQTYTVTVEAVEGQQVDVEIPELTPELDDEDGSSAGDDGDGGASNRRSDAGRPTRRPDNDISGARPPARLFRWLSIGTIGAGVAAGITGLGLSLSARRVRNRAFDDGLCDPDMFACDSDGWQLMRRADARSEWSNIALGAGVVAVGAGVILYWTGPRHKHPDATALRPMAGPERVGLVVSGRF